MEGIKTLMAYDVKTLSVIKAILAKPDKVKISSGEGQFSLIQTAAHTSIVGDKAKDQSK